MLRLMLTILIGCMLSACATRGALNIDCPRFADYIVKLPPSPLVRDIQADAGGAALAQVDVEADDPLQQSLDAAFASRDPVTLAAAHPRGTDILLLSGGGQWGAFGAGFLDRLWTAHRDQFPQAGIITGVSTGGLQSLFLAVGGDAAMAEMVRRYQPAAESQLVNRNAQWQAVVTGSIAGLKPLHRAISAALCTDGDPAKGCPMIDALAGPTSAAAFIGFVDAESGDFYYVPVRRLAALPDRREAQQCIAGAALASAAMPVFFQQVKVGGHVYYDGGVRQSVFETAVASKAFAAATRARATSLPTMFVVRNGPTVLGPASIQKDADALTAALRAEAIIVNQLEVQSIADLRLAHPTGTIRLITADGYDNVPCVKAGHGVMFDPVFMRCLRGFGQARADRVPPWRELGELSSGEPSDRLRLRLRP